MKILVTGANGMLGQDLCPILEDEGYDVVETDIHNLDITVPKDCDQILTKEKPEIVIHCAAYTNVDQAESDIVTATRINVKGTENIAKACEKINAILIYISTDYVFDGKKTKPYIPTDQTNPINNYGLTKFKGEEAVKHYCKNYYIVRTSWLYGHYGKNFVETMLSLKNKKDLKIVNDQIGCPTWTVELANGIIQLIDNKNHFGTYHICGSGETSWYEFAKEIFKLENVNADIKPCTTDEFPRSAKRPKFSVMANNNSCRNWKVALKEYLALRLNEEY